AELFHQLSQALEVLTDAAAKIARLREEGSRQLEEEQRLIREQIQREREAQQHQTEGYSQRNSGVERCSKSNVTPKLKLKWKCKKGDETNGGYSEDILFRLLRKELAVKNECGLTENPLKILWLEGQPEVIAPTSQPGQFMSQWCKYCHSASSGLEQRVWLNGPQFICFGVVRRWPGTGPKPLVGTLINKPDLGDPRNARVSHSNSE
ncbi:DnaJ-like protein subfamily C member 17, partial [Nibea albiflora]